jgi:hypothetical protein
MKTTILIDCEASKKNIIFILQVLHILALVSIMLTKVSIHLRIMLSILVYINYKYETFGKNPNEIAKIKTNNGIDWEIILKNDYKVYAKLIPPLYISGIIIIHFEDKFSKKTCRTAILKREIHKKELHKLMFFLNRIKI